MIPDVSMVVMHYKHSALLSTSCALSTQAPTCSNANEDEELNRFLEEGCGCQVLRGRPCFRLFSKEHYEKVRLECRELERNQLDLVILGQIMGGLNDQQETTAQKYGHGHQERSRASMTFTHRGQRICKETFLKSHGIGIQHNTLNKTLQTKRHSAHVF